MFLKGNRTFFLLLAPKHFLLSDPLQKGGWILYIARKWDQDGMNKIPWDFCAEPTFNTRRGGGNGDQSDIDIFKCFATNYMIFFLPDALVWQKFNSLQSVPWWLNAHLVDNTSSYFSPQQQSCLDERLLLDALSSGSYFTSYKSKIYSRQKRHLHGNAYYEIMPDVQMFYNYDFLFWRCS